MMKKQNRYLILVHGNCPYQITRDSYEVRIWGNIPDKLTN